MTLQFGYFVAMKGISELYHSGLRGNNVAFLLDDTLSPSHRHFLDPFGGSIIQHAAQKVLYLSIS